MFSKILSSPYSLLLVSIAFISCGSSDKKLDDDQVYFNVDPAQLNLTYNDNQALFSFKLPKGLTELNSISNLSDSELEYDSLVLAVYFDSATQAAVIVKSIPQYQSFLTEVTRSPDSLFNLNGQWATINSTTFKHHRLLIQQVLLENNDVINLKLFFENNQEGREVEFLVHRNAYADIVRSIESSIGSISVTNKSSHLNKKINK
jgi:hypothetical protein